MMVCSGSTKGAGVVEQLREFLDCIWRTFRQHRRKQSPRHTSVRASGRSGSRQRDPHLHGALGNGRTHEYSIDMPGRSCSGRRCPVSLWPTSTMQFLNWLRNVVGPSGISSIRFDGCQARPLRQIIRSCLSSAAAAEPVLGTAPLVQGIEGPCDMYVFHEFGVPAVLWGARGSNTHNPDEYVELSSVERAAAALLSFVCRWCGVAV